MSLHIRLVIKNLGRKRKVFVENEWRKLVDPAFAEYWSSMKQMELAGRLKDHSGSKTAFRRAFQRLSLASRSFDVRQSKVKSPIAVRAMMRINALLDGEGKVASVPGMVYAVNPESSGVFRQLVFLKYGITFRDLVVEIETNPKAYKQLIAVHRDYYRMISSEVSLNRLKLKFNSKHFSIILQGLDFGFKDLTEFQLADCLDEICPCGKSHSAEYSKKLRTRIETRCRIMISSTKRTSRSAVGPERA